MGEEHSQNQRNCWEISNEKLRLGSTHDPIEMNIPIMGHKEYGRCVRGSGEYALGKLFASPFLHKVKISHTYSGDSKYDDGQEIRTGPPESRDGHKQRISKFDMRKNGVDLSHDRGSRLFQRRPPSGSQGRKA